MTQYLSKGKNYALRTEILAQVQNEATKLTRALSLDLSRANHERFQWATGSLILLSSRSVDSDEPAIEFDTSNGKALWRQWAAFYLDSGSSVVRRFQQRIDPYTSDQFAVNSVWELADLPGLPQVQGRPIAAKIEEFVPTGKANSQSIEFRVVAKDKLPLGNRSEEAKIVRVETTTIIRLGSVVNP